MATAAQILATRLNAMKSTGPRTAEGKNASSRNALQHGLCAEKHLLAFEDAAGFDSLHQDLRSRFRPIGDGEEKLVLRIAQAQWRLDRAFPLETQIFESQIRRFDGTSHANGRPDSELLGPAFISDCVNSQSLMKLSRYEAALERSIKNNLHQLDVFQKARLARDAEPAAVPAAPATKPTQSTVIEFTPAATYTLQVAIAGPSGMEYTQIGVRKEAKLDGFLSLNLLDGYVPDIGQTFTFLTAARITNKFCGVKGLDISPDRRFRLNYTPDELTLTVEAVQPA